MKAIKATFRLQWNEKLGSVYIRYESMVSIDARVTSRKYFEKRERFWKQFLTFPLDEPSAESQNQHKIDLQA